MTSKANSPSKTWNLGESSYLQKIGLQTVFQSASNKPSFILMGLKSALYAVKSCQGQHSICICSILHYITEYYYSKLKEVTVSYQFNFHHFPSTSGVSRLQASNNRSTTTSVEKQKSYVNTAHVTWTHINLPDLVRSPSGFPRFSFTVQGKARSPEQHFLPCHTLSCSIYLKTMSLASTRKRRLGPPRQASQRLHLTCFLLFSYMSCTFGSFDCLWRYGFHTFPRFLI